MNLEVFSNLTDSGVSLGFSHCPCSRNTGLGFNSLLLPAVPAWAFFHSKAYQQSPQGTGTMIPTSSKALGCLTPGSLLQLKCLISQPFTPVHVDLIPWLIPVRQLLYLWDIPWFLCSDFSISALFLISQGSSCSSQLYSWERGCVVSVISALEKQKLVSSSAFIFCFDTAARLTKERRQENHCYQR